ncbi:unnamed protein product [Chilo suppressalis]|uniref:FLYWCH-type domain-containing protein n=1 Tax=Chilo suppressalis TaxID=168631 RepID=A0ABN8B141_CHISP|nr:unnamed protein product [Chilo suppressalis]
MALTPAEKQRCYREKRKIYPEKEAKAKRKDLERYHARKRLVTDISAGESRNKFWRQDREHHSRKDSKVHTMTDLFHRALVSSDPVISAIRLKHRLVLTNTRKKLSDEGKKAKRREQGKLAMRKLREKIKKNPEALEEQRQKYREYYHRKKEKGFIRTIKDISTSEQRRLRQKWREASQKHRLVLANTSKKLSEEGKKAKRREQKKQFMRRLREKIKKNPEALEVQRQKDREYYQRKKEKGFIKTIKDISTKVLLKGVPEDAQFFAVISKDEDITHDSADEEEALFVESKRGTTILQYKGQRYRRAYSTKHGNRWLCSVNKGCGAFVCLNSDDEIIMTNETHSHPKPARLERVDDKQDDVAVVITSRKGKELLLFRQFTYRKQYFKHNKARWVCSNDKNCRGVIFTDSDNVVTSAFEEHCHPPPKYYLKADNVIGALREPLVFESD